MVKINGLRWMFLGWSLVCMGPAAMALAEDEPPPEDPPTEKEPIDMEALLEEQALQAEKLSPDPGELLLGRKIGPVSPYLDRAIPGIGSIDPTVTEDLTPDEKLLESSIPMHVLLDIIYLFNVDLQSRLPDTFADLDREEQYKYQLDIMIEGGYPELLLGLGMDDIVDRAYFSRVLYSMIGGQIDCEASLRASGAITQPEGMEATLTSDEIMGCFVQEGIMESSDAAITGVEIRDILANPGLDWRRVLDPGAGEILTPFENSLEGVFVTPLSPDSPLQKDEI